MNKIVGNEIVDFILKDKKNIALAVSIHNVFDDIRKEIIKGFTTVLCKTLEQKLPPSDGWEMNANGLINDPLGSYPCVGVRKNHWPTQIEVGIEAQSSKGALNWIYGVMGKEGYESAPGLKANLDNKMSFGSASTQWIWYRNLNEPWRNWNTPESLISMRDGEIGEICIYLTNEIQNLAYHVATFIPSP